jgi:hypothetical protein
MPRSKEKEEQHRDTGPSARAEYWGTSIPRDSPVARTAETAVSRLNLQSALAVPKAGTENEAAGATHSIRAGRTVSAVCGFNR